MKRIATVLLAIACALVLAACAGAPTFSAPNSSIAADENGLFQIMLYLSVGVAVFVEGWLIYNVIRFRRRPGDDSLPEQIYGNRNAEIIWTVLPILLVGGIFALTVRTVTAVSPPAPSPDDLQLHVVGHQWWWEFDYPDLGILTANELHVPTGATVQITLDSVDVIHSFWVPQLSGKVDAVPGQTNHMWFRADAPGEFHGQCAEFCGLNHANMRIKVVVQTPDDFAAWVAGQQQPPVEPQTDQQRQGQEIVTGGICQNCHTVGDNLAENETGPNLTHLMSRSVFAGAIFDLNEPNLRRWLTENQTMKPGNDMSVNPKPDQIDPLVAYLITLK